MTIICPRRRREARAAVRAAYEMQGLSPPLWPSGCSRVPGRANYHFEIMRASSSPRTVMLPSLLFFNLMVNEARKTPGPWPPRHHAASSTSHHRSLWMGTLSSSRLPGVRQDRHPSEGTKASSVVWARLLCSCSARSCPPLSAASAMRDKFGCSGAWTC